MPSEPCLPARSPTRLPTGVLRFDYLKFLQISIADELRADEFIDGQALEQAMTAICRGSMRAAQPAMKVFFDGCRFWLASHFHRHEAARRLGVRHQEFWCEIEPGPKGNAVRYASGVAPGPHACVVEFPLTTSWAALPFQTFEPAATLP